MNTSTRFQFEDDGDGDDADPGSGPLDSSVVEGSHLAVLQEVFCDAAYVLGVTVCSQYPATKTTAAQLMKTVLKAIDTLVDQFSGINVFLKAFEYVTKGLKYFALRKYSQAHKKFEKASALELVLSPGELAPPNAALVSCVFCRLQMYSALHVNNCFLDAGRGGMYVAGVECAALYDSLFASEHVLTCLADEFDPLPMKLMRLPTHTPATRVPVLRDLASLRGILHQKFKFSFPIRTSVSETQRIICMKKLLILEDSGLYTHCLASSPSGVLYSGGDEAVVRQWCSRTGSLLKTLVGHSSAVNCLLGLDGGCVSGSEDAQLMVWREGDGGVECVRRHGAGVRCLALVQPHNLLLSGGADGEIRLWDISDRRALVLLNTLYDVMPVNSMAAVVTVTKGIEEQKKIDVYSACGSSSDCSEIRCWRGVLDEAVVDGDGEEFSLRVLPVHRHCVLCLQRDPESGFLVSSSADFSLRVWDHQLRAVAARDVGMAVGCMVVYKDILYTASPDNSSVHLWDLNSLEPIGVFDQHEGPVLSLHVADGRLFTAGMDCSILEHLL